MSFTYHTFGIASTYKLCDSEVLSVRQQFYFEMRYVEMQKFEFYIYVHCTLFTECTYSVVWAVNAPILCM